MPANELTIQKMQASDLSVMDSLRAMENWNQTQADLESFLHYEPEGCFLALWDGTPAGTVTTTTYGADLGWIGMMLVHPEYRRRGIASALIQTSLDYLNRVGVSCIKLDATPAGEPVYERLGFRSEWTFQRWERAGAPPPVFRDNAETFEPSDDDARAFGANRSTWLKSLAERSRVVEDAGGFGMLRGGLQAAYLGPVISDDPTRARRMIQELLGSCESRVFWDVPGPNAAAVEIATALGFQPVRTLLRMWTGRTLLSGDVSRQYAIADPATG